MDGKAEKVFMNMLINKIKLTTHLLLSRIAIGLALLGGCSQDLSDDLIPPIQFPDIIINLNLPAYTALAAKGGFKEIGGGVRGIIVYCEEVGVYHAFERNCSFHPNDACATVNVDNSKLFMIDPCCGSSFDFTTGKPIGGAAWNPLRKYKTSVTASELTITDDIVD